MLFLYLILNIFNNCRSKEDEELERLVEEEKMRVIQRNREIKEEEEKQRLSKLKKTIKNGKNNEKHIKSIKHILIHQKSLKHDKKSLKHENNAFQY